MNVRGSLLSAAKPPGAVSLERELTEIRRKIKSLIGEIENGRGSANEGDRLYELD